MRLMPNTLEILVGFILGVVVVAVIWLLVLLAGAAPWLEELP